MSFEQQFPSTPSYSQQPSGQASAVQGQRSQQRGQDTPTQSQQSSFQQQPAQQAQMQGPKTQQIESQQGQAQSQPRQFQQPQGQQFTQPQMQAQGPQFAQPRMQAQGQQLTGPEYGQPQQLRGQQYVPSQPQFQQMPGQQYAQAVPQTEQFARSQVQQYPSQQNVQPRAQLPAQQFARPQVQPRFQRGLSQQYRYALGQFQRAQPPQLSGEGAIAQQSATPQQQLAQQPGLTASGVQQPVPSMGAGGIPQQPAMDLSQQPVAGIPQQSPVGTAGPAATNVPQQPAMGPAQQVPGGQPVQQFPTRGLRLPSLSAEDIIRTDVVTASADASISSIASDMADYGVGSVVIVEDEVPIGLITDREIALSIKNMPDLSDRTVGEVIDERIVTGSMDMSLFDLLDLMSAEAVRRIPIVDDAGRLQGIIALDDVLVLLEQKLGQATEVVKAQIPEA